MFVHRPSKKGAYQAPDWLRNSFFCFIVLLFLPLQMPLIGERLPGLIKHDTSQLA